jgi:hypothetical protein
MNKGLFVSATIMTVPGRPSDLGNGKPRKIDPKNAEGLCRELERAINNLLASGAPFSEEYLIYGGTHCVLSTCLRRPVSGDNKQINTPPARKGSVLHSVEIGCK